MGYGDHDHRRLAYGSIDGAYLLMHPAQNGYPVDIMVCGLMAGKVITIADSYGEAEHKVGVPGVTSYPVRLLSLALQRIQ